MLRLALILALLASIGGLAVSLLVTKPKVEQLTADLASTQDTLSQTEQQLAETQRKEKAATAAAEQAQLQLTETTAALETTTAEATRQKTRADKLDLDLNKAVSERNQAQAELAQWEALGVQPAQVSQLRADLREVTEERDALEDEKQVFLRSISQLNNRLLKYEAPDQKVKLPDGLRGNVLAVSPEQDFVLLDIGANQGVLERGELMVRRGDQLVGKVRVVTVEPNRSFANILGDWQPANVNVATGDAVLY